MKRPSERAFCSTRGVALVAFAFGSLYASLALARFSTFHNETFDLAFYARLVWGLQHGDSYQPLAGATLWGLHASPVLYPLAALTWPFPVAPALLVLQAYAVAAAAIPLARLAARRIAHPLAPYLAMGAYLLYPAIWTVASYEFHPGSLALLPLALALDAFDEEQIRRGCVALFFAALCREDVALVAALVGVAVGLRREHRGVGALVFASGVSWFALYVFVIAPRYRPPVGAFDEHYGHLGGSPWRVLVAILLQPVKTLGQLATPVRLLYGSRLLAPLAFLPLLAPRWLLPALAPFALNVLSAFPTATQIHSHYATPIVPFAVAAAIHGAAHTLRDRGAGLPRWQFATAAVLAIATLCVHWRAAISPLGRGWDSAAITPGRRAHDLPRLLGAVPPRAPVAAPDYVLPHLAERDVLQRLWPSRGVEYVVLSTEHRVRFAFTQDLWRSVEEAAVHNALARADFGVVAVEGEHLLLRRGHDPRAFARGRYVEFGDVRAPRSTIAIDESVAVQNWSIRPTRIGSAITLVLIARTRWPHDLFLELGWGAMRDAGDRQDPQSIVAALPFDGLFAPSHVRSGEATRTVILVPVPPSALRSTRVYLGVRRIDGSRLDPDSLHWTQLPVNDLPAP